MSHGLTDAQIMARAKDMPAQVSQILKDAKRQEAKKAAADEASRLYDDALIERGREQQRLIALHQRDQFEHGQHDADALAAAKDAYAEIEEERAQRRADRAKRSGGLPSSSEIVAFIANKAPKARYRPNIPEIKIPKGQTRKDVWIKNKADVDAIHAAIRGAENAWLPEPDAFAKAVALIDEIAITGAPDVRGLFRLTKPNRLAPRAEQGDIEWPQTLDRDGEFQPDGFALTVWLHRDALVDRLRKELAAIARPDSLSVAEREAKIAALRIELLQAQRLEHAAFLLAAKEDKSLQPRKVDMRALLQIEEVPASEAPAIANEDLEFG